MKQFLIAIPLTMSITIGVSAQVPDNISSREESSLIFNVDASMAATDRILGLK